MVKVGRYLVLENGARCVIARNEEENTKLAQSNPQMEQIILLDCVGPLGLVEKDAGEEDKILAGRIALSYGKTESGRAYQVQIGEKIHHLMSLEREKAQNYLLLM